MLILAYFDWANPEYSPNRISSVFLKNTARLPCFFNGKLHYNLSYALADKVRLFTTKTSLPTHVPEADVGAVIVYELPLQKLTVKPEFNNLPALLVVNNNLAAAFAGDYSNIFKPWAGYYPQSKRSDLYRNFHSF